MNIDIDVKILYGCYSWCGNNYDDQKSGYYLTLYDKDKKGYGSPQYNLMLYIEVKMPLNLHKEFNIIEIYDKNNFCAQYIF